MPGRRRTGSSPVRTSISDALYEELMESRSQDVASCQTRKSAILQNVGLAGAHDTPVTDQNRAKPLLFQEKSANRDVRTAGLTGWITWLYRGWSMPTASSDPPRRAAIMAGVSSKRRK